MNLLTSLLQLPRPAKRAISVVIDVFAILTSLSLALLLSRDAISIDSALSWLGLVTWLLIGSIAVFVKLGLYRAVVRYVSVRAFGVVLTGAAFSTLLLWGLLFAFHVDLPLRGLLTTD